MSKSKIISGTIVLINIVLAFLFLDLKIAAIVSVFSLAITFINIWPEHHIEIGTYALTTGRNFWSDSQVKISGWIILILILVVVLLFSIISFTTGETITL